jgi:hypothetical protein
VGYYYSDDDDFTEVRDVGGIYVATTDKYRAFHDGNVSVSLTIPFKKYFAVTPILAYSFPLSSEADDLLSSPSWSISGKSDHFYGGVSLSFSF